MPYIKKEKRPNIDEIIDIIDYNRLSYGDIRFLLFMYCHDNIKPSYNNYKNFCGELDQCVIEIYRRKKLNIFNKIYGVIKTFWYSFTPQNDYGIKLVHERMYEKDIKADGDLNYLLYKTHLYVLKDTAKFCKSLKLAKRDIERYLLACYEDQKILENTDI